MPVTDTAASFGTVCVSWTKCGQNCSSANSHRMDGENLSVAVSGDKIPLCSAESVWANTAFNPKWRS